MRVSFANTVRLGIKELHSLRADPVLIAIILYAFTIAVYSVATGEKYEVERASVAIADEDHSVLSRRIATAIGKPMFQEPAQIDASQIDAAMDHGQYVFVVEIPPRFEADVVAGRRPELQIDVDATAMSQAGNGATFLQTIIAGEIRNFVTGAPGGGEHPVSPVIRLKFNPNAQYEWFGAVMQIIGNITLLSVILSGAALIREREHGTIEHLLVMPVTPMEIMLSKIWANGSVIVAAALLSLLVIGKWMLQAPIAGSFYLFVFGAALYQFSVTALGILIATFTSSMQQFGLLVIPLLVAMNLLSGSRTPLESMPQWLQTAMQISPSTHFVRFSQAVLYRAADWSAVWPDLLALAVIGTVFFAAAIRRFRLWIATNQ